MRLDAASATIGLHDDRAELREHPRGMIESQRTVWHCDARDREPLRERVLVADEPDGVAGGAEIDDTGPFDAFEKHGQEIVGLGGDDESRVDGGERRIERIEGLPGRHRITRDDSTGKPDGHSAVEHDGDILSGGMEVFHETAQHATTLGEKARVEGPAGEATAAKVFVDQNPHDASREKCVPVVKRLLVRRHSLTFFRLAA
jgi:hypothetical protein